MQAHHSGTLNVVRVSMIFLTLGFLSSAVLVEKASAEEWPVGVWERKGYGDVLQVKQNGRIKFYERTRETCVLRFTEPLEDTVAEYSRLRVSTRGKTSIVTATPEGSVFDEVWTKLGRRPVLCNMQNLIDDRPTSTFEHFVSNFTDYYAFFEERKIDWPARVTGARLRVHDAMSQAELRKELVNLVRGFNDGHITIETPETDFAAYSPEKQIEGVLSRGFVAQNEYKGFDKYYNAKLSEYAEILVTYFDSDSATTAGGDDNFTWATIGSGAVGYLSIDAMDFVSEKSDPDEIDDVRATRKLMLEIMEDIGDTHALVIDVRNNGGGWDSVGFAIAGHFVEQRQFAMSKNTRSFEGQTPRISAFITPHGGTVYDKPIVVIAGPDTASAAEVFLLAMRALPNAALIVGQPSEGIFSDQLSKALPIENWEFEFSNQVYFDHEDEEFEALGVPPDVATAVFSLEDLEAGRNSALELALDALGFGWAHR